MSAYLPATYNSSPSFFTFYFESRIHSVAQVALYFTLWPRDDLNW